MSRSTFATLRLADAIRSPLRATDDPGTGSAGGSDAVSVATAIGAGRFGASGRTGRAIFACLVDLAAMCLSPTGLGGGGTRAGETSSCTVSTWVAPSGAGRKRPCQSSAVTNTTCTTIETSSPRPSWDAGPRGCLSTSDGQRRHRGPHPHEKLRISTLRDSIPGIPL